MTIGADIKNWVLKTRDGAFNPNREYNPLLQQLYTTGYADITKIVRAVGPELKQAIVDEQNRLEGAIDQVTRRQRDIQSGEANRQYIDAQNRIDRGYGYSLSDRWTPEQHLEEDIRIAKQQCKAWQSFISTRAQYFGRILDAIETQMKEKLSKAPPEKQAKQQAGFDEMIAAIAETKEDFKNATRVAAAEVRPMVTNFLSAHGTHEMGWGYLQFDY